MSDRFAATLGEIIGDTLVDLAKVERAPKEEDAEKKMFNIPSVNRAGIYIIRDTNAGQAYKKKIYMDGKRIGATSPKVFIYTEVTSGEHVLSTSSVLGKNGITINAKPGELYFARQSLRFGIIFRRAALGIMSPEEGKEAVLKCELAKQK